MKLGLLTAPFEGTDLLEVADWTAANGMSALEIACWPATGDAARRYAGTTHIDVNELSVAQGDEVIGALADKGIEVSGLGYYPNPLHSDADHRDQVIGHLKKVIRAASLMNVPVVNTFLGGERGLTVDENWDRAAQIFPDIVAHAEDNGVILAFENCPMIFSSD